MSDLDDSDVEPEIVEEVEETEEKFTPSGTSTSKKLIGTVDSEDDDNDDDDDNNDDNNDDDDDDELLTEDEGSIDETTESSNPLTYIENPNTNDSKYDDASQLSPINSDVETDDEDHLKKFENTDPNMYVKKFHPECLVGNSTEVESLTKIVRNTNNVIIDDNHRTNPFLSKYEKTKILGQRTKQLNSGAKPFVSVAPNIIDNYIIAQMELAQKKIPVIVRRPLPSGKSEYWKLHDLELIS